MSAGDLQRDLAAIVGARNAIAPPPAAAFADATEGRGLRGRADALVIPADTAEVAAVVAYCYSNEVAITPRGGGTGFAGGAVPDGGIVVSPERLNAVRSLDAAQWRMHVQAGVTTATVRRRAREQGLLFPPDPGAAETSQIGANIATNAGGPHAFKYGVTGAWVSGLELVLAPGEIVRTGGPVRKDASGYDLTALMVGSEGTLGIVTAAWLRLVPAPEAAFALAVAFSDARAGCAAVGRVMEAGIQAAALEFLDRGAIAAAALGAGFPATLPRDAGFLVIAEADGSAAEAARVRDELREILGEGALVIHAPEGLREMRELWRWRDGVSHAVTAQRGGKVSEDVVVPVERLEDVVAFTLDLGVRHGLESCSWGHAGDGNVHATFLLDATDEAALARARDASEELFALAVSLGGTVSGEHGAGLVKRDALAAQLGPAGLAAQRAIKYALDPMGLLNPGKKLPPR